MGKIEVRDTTGARNAFPLLGIIPPLSPIEHSEGVRDDKYVRSSVTTRLSSRHFRNQRRLLRTDGEFEDFAAYMSDWLDGVELSSFDSHYDGKEIILDVYYNEEGTERVGLGWRWNPSLASDSLSYLQDPRPGHSHTGRARGLPPR